MCLVFPIKRKSKKKLPKFMKNCAIFLRKVPRKSPFPTFLLDGIHCTLKIDMKLVMKINAPFAESIEV